MNTALILKSDGLVYVCRLPEEPKKWDYESGGDPPEISPYVMPDYYYHLEEYNAAKQKAIKEAVLCADQEQAHDLLEPILRRIRIRLAKERQLSESYVASYGLDGDEIKETPYIIPGLDYQHEWTNPCIPVRRCLISTETPCKNDIGCQKAYMQAILLLPKQEEEEQYLKEKIEFIKGAFQCYVGYENTDGLKKFLNESHYTISKKK
jgi:hypothetical protein